MFSYNEDIDTGIVEHKIFIYVLVPEVGAPVNCFLSDCTPQVVIISNWGSVEGDARGLLRNLEELFI